MTDFRTLLADLRRPRLLIRAARFGVADYKRERDLRRLINASTRATPEAAIPQLISAEEHMEETRRAGDAGGLRVRIISYAAGIEPMIAIAGTGPTPWLYEDRLRLVGVKIYTDGALGSRGAFLKADYADKAGQRGLSFLNATKLSNLIDRKSVV